MPQDWLGAEPVSPALPAPVGPELPAPVASPALPTPGRIPIITRDGQYGTIPEDQLADALKMGASVATTQERDRADAEAEARAQFGALTTPVAGLAAGARGLTLGLSDYALQKGAGLVGADEHKTGRVLRGLEQAAPIVSGATELLGNVLPVAFTGGAGAAAEGAARAGEAGLARTALKVASAPVRAASELGAGAGRLLERGIGEAGERTVLGRLGTGLASAGVSGAVEGGLYGAGSAISESVLEDKDLTAEELLASMGGAALFGGALGSLSSAPFLGAGEAIRGAKAAGTALARTAEEAAPVLSDAFRRGGAKASELAKEGIELAKGAVDLNDPQSLLSRADAAVSDTLLDADKLKAMSNEQAARITYGRKKFVDEANARIKAGPNGEAAGWEGVGEVLKNAGIVDVKKGVMENAMTLEQAAEKIGKAVDDRGASIGDLTKNSAATVKVGDVAGAIEKEINAFRGKAGFESIVATLEDYRDSLYHQFGAYVKPDGTLSKKLQIGKEIPLADLNVQRKALDDLMYREQKALDPKLRVEGLRNIRGGLKDLERDAIIREGRIDAKAYDTLNREYQALRIAQDATDDSISRGGANRSVGATDYLAFVGGAAGGGAVGGAAMALANKIARERGSGAASVFLHNLAETKSLVRAAKMAGADVQAAGMKALPQAKALAAKAAPIAERAMVQVEDAVQAMRRSQVLEEVAKRGAGVRADIAKVATTIASSGAKGLKVASDVRRIGALRGYLTYEAYEKRRKEIEAMKDTPGLVDEGLGKRLGGVVAAAPELGFALAMQAGHIVDYLASKLPPSDVDPYTLTPFARAAKSRELSAAQVRFMRAAAVADDPRVALRHLEAGTLSIDEADALRVAWPRIYESTRNAILQSFAERDPKLGPLPYQKQVQLSIMFDAPTSRSLTGDFIQSMQETNDPLPEGDKPGGEQGKPPPPGGPKLNARPLNLPNMGAPTEAIEQRELRTA